MAIAFIGFITILLGFLLQWPTLPTLVLFPILVTMYVRQARRRPRSCRGFGVSQSSRFDLLSHVWQHRKRWATGKCASE